MLSINYNNEIYFIDTDKIEYIRVYKDSFIRPDNDVYLLHIQFINSFILFRYSNESIRACDLAKLKHKILDDFKSLRNFKCQLECIPFNKDVIPVDHQKVISDKNIENNENSLDLLLTRYKNENK